MDKDAGGRGADTKAIFGWVLFDFANSAYTTLIVTFIYATYFVGAIAPDQMMGTGLWSRGITITALSVAIASPFLGALADQGNLRKTFLFISTAIAVVTTALLNFIHPGHLLAALACFVVSNIAFELTMVFYNAFLPEIAPREKIGRISGLGWGMGYVGGLLAMVVALMGFINPEVPWFGLSKQTGAHIRATTLLTAGWFAVFALPLFLFVKGKAVRPAAPKAIVVRDAWADLKATFREIRQYREIVKFLLARLIYNDGLVTVFAFGGIYAAAHSG